MTRGVRIFLGSVLLVLLLAAGVLWLAADRLLDEVVRPWIAERASDELGAEVRLERLTYAEGRLVLAGLTLNHPREFLLSVESVEVRFNWSGLLDRRINQVTILHPHLTWMAPGDSTKSTGEVALPPAPPLRIDAWQVEDGHFELHWGERQLLFSRVAAEGGLDRQFPLDISARFGVEPGVPLHLIGRVTWQKIPVLNLDELAWNDKNLLTRPLTMTADAGLTGGAHLGIEKLDDSDVVGLLAALGEPLPWPEGLHWQLTTLDINFSQDNGNMAAHLSTGPGALQMSGKEWPWRDFDLQVKGPFERMALAGVLGLAGTSSLALNGTWDGQQLNGEWNVSVGDLARLLQSVGMAMPSSSVAPRELKLHGTLEASLDKVLISDSRLVASLGSQSRLEGKLRGAWQDNRLTLNCDQLKVMAGSDNLLVDGAISLRGDPAEEDWRGDWSLKVIDGLRLAKLSGVTLADDLPNIQDLSLAGQLRWRAGQLRLPGVSMTGRLTGSEISGRLRGQFALHASPAFDLSVRFDSLVLDSLEYQAADGMTGLTGGRLGLHGQFDLIGKKLTFNLSGQAGVTEALVQSWYGNLAELPLRFAASGSWFGDRQSLELATADFDLAGLVSSHCTGSYSVGRTGLKVQLDVPHLGGTFQRVFQTLAGELLPGVERLFMAGRLQLGGALLTEGPQWSLDLLLTPMDVSVNWDQTTKIDKLHGQLPIFLRNGRPIAGEPSELATLAWSGLQASLIKSGPGRLALMSAPNRWRQVQPLELAAAGGTVRLNSLQIDLQEFVPKLQASLELIGIELLQVSRTLEWPEMGGQLSAKLEDVHVSPHEIGTVGEATVQAFGGDFSIHNMHVEAPFSRFPTYHADVDFTGIDLYQLTNTFEFGEMNGIVDGYVHELRLFDGTPSSFKARLETRDEGTRNISVKAIRNLNTLSQGGLSAALSHGIYRFIDFYRYRKIGIVCSLQNDLFHLEGTGRPDSNQYLVYGGLLPPRIDVVVSSPTISFKEMVRRLKRIERTDR